MSEVFILQNQHNQFLDKHGDWIEPGQSSQLYRTAHRDEAINVKVEHSVRDPALRVSIQPCSLNAKGQPQLAAGTEHPTIDRVTDHRFSPEGKAAEGEHLAPQQLPANEPLME